MFDHLTATELNVLRVGLEICLGKGKASGDSETSQI